MSSVSLSVTIRYRDLWCTYCCVGPYACETWYFACHNIIVYVSVSYGIHVILSVGYLAVVSARVFGCLLFYCQTLPMKYLIDQRIVLFGKKALICDSSVIQQGLEILLRKT